MTIIISEIWKKMKRYTIMMRFDYFAASSKDYKKLKQYKNTVGREHACLKRGALS